MKPAYVKENLADKAMFELVFGAYPLPSVDDPEKNDSQYVFRWSWVRKKSSVISAQKVLFSPSKSRAEEENLGLDMYFPTVEDLEKKYTLTIKNVDNKSIKIYRYTARPDLKLVPALDVSFYAFLLSGSTTQPGLPIELKGFEDHLRVVKKPPNAPTNAQEGWYLGLAKKLDDKEFQQLNNIYNSQTNGLDSDFKPAIKEIIDYTKIEVPDYTEGSSFPPENDAKNRPPPLTITHQADFASGPTIKQLCDAIRENGEQKFLTMIQNAAESAGFVFFDKTEKKISDVYVALCLWGANVRDNNELQDKLAESVIQFQRYVKAVDQQGNKIQFVRNLATVIQYTIDMTEPRRRLALAMATGTTLPFWDPVAKKIVSKLVPEVFGWQSEVITLETNGKKYTATLQYDDTPFEYHLRKADGTSYEGSVTDWYEESLQGFKKARLSANRVEQAYWKIHAAPLNSYNPWKTPVRESGLFWEERWINLGFDIPDTDISILKQWNRTIREAFRGTETAADKLPPRFLRRRILANGPIRLFVVLVGDLSVTRDQAIQFNNFPEWCLKTREIFLHAIDQYKPKLDILKDALLTRGRPGNLVEQVSTVGNGKFAVSVSGVAGKTAKLECTRFTRAAIVPRKDKNKPKDIELVPASGFIPRSDALFTSGVHYEQIAMQLALTSAEKGSIEKLEAIDKFIELTVVRDQDGKAHCYGRGMEVISTKNNEAGNSPIRLSDIDYIEPLPEKDSFKQGTALNPVVVFTEAKDPIDLWLKCSDFLGQWRYWVHVDPDKDSTWVSTGEEVRIQWSTPLAPIPEINVKFPDPGPENQDPSGFEHRECILNFKSELLKLYLTENFEVGTTSIPELDIFLFRRAPKIDFSLTESMNLILSNDAEEIAEEYENEEWFVNLIKDRWLLATVIRKENFSKDSLGKEDGLPWAKGGWEYKIAIVALRNEESSLIPNGKRRIPVYQVSEIPIHSEADPKKDTKVEAGWIAGATLPVWPMGRMGQPFFSNVFLWSTINQVSDFKESDLEHRVHAIMPIRAPHINPERVLLKIPNYVDLDVNNKTHLKHFEDYVRTPYIEGLKSRLKKLAGNNLADSEPEVREQLERFISLVFTPAENLPDVSSGQPDEINAKKEQIEKLRSSVNSIIEPRGIIEFRYLAPELEDKITGLPIAASRISLVEDHTEFVSVNLKESRQSSPELEVSHLVKNQIQSLKRTLALLFEDIDGWKYMGRIDQNDFNPKVKLDGFKFNGLPFKGSNKTGYLDTTYQAGALVSAYSFFLAGSFEDQESVGIKILLADLSLDHHNTIAIGECYFFRVRTDDNSVLRFLGVLFSVVGDQAHLRVYDPQRFISPNSKLKIILGAVASRAQTLVISTDEHVPDDLSLDAHEIPPVYYPIPRGPNKDLGFRFQRAGPGRIVTSRDNKDKVAPYWSTGWTRLIELPGSQIPAVPEVITVIPHHWAIEIQFSSVYLTSKFILGKDAEVDLRIIRSMRGAPGKLYSNSLTLDDTLTSVAEMSSWGDFFSKIDEQSFGVLKGWFNPVRSNNMLTDVQDSIPPFKASEVWKHKDQQPRIFLVDSELLNDAPGIFGADIKFVPVPHLRELYSFSMGFRIRDNIKYPAEFHLTSDWSENTQEISPLPPIVNLNNTKVSKIISRSDDLSFIYFQAKISLPNRSLKEIDAVAGPVKFDLLLRPESHARAPVVGDNSLVSYTRSKEFVSRVPVIAGPDSTPDGTGSRIDIVLKDQAPSSALMKIFLETSIPKLNFQVLLRETIKGGSFTQEIWQHDLGTINIDAPKPGTDCYIDLDMSESFKNKSSVSNEYTIQVALNKVKVSITGLLSDTKTPLAISVLGNNIFSCDVAAARVQKDIFLKLNKKSPLVLFQHGDAQVILIEKNELDDQHLSMRVML